MEMLEITKCRILNSHHFLQCVCYYTVFLRNRTSRQLLSVIQITFSVVNALEKRNLEEYLRTYSFCDYFKNHLQ